ncbi:hypothetical protein LHGZ1_0768 [Laribacter hongkongensis]|uniref:Uncharacterized protein n=1 Tax=Laribacter hongkongensis TaxID=168471 RepID=A0A248LGL3_9NEIS|nr:hypothetical protein LHGZ1_0768 [Laribacter hongkongensis]
MVRLIEAPLLINHGQITFHDDLICLNLVRFFGEIKKPAILLAS